MFSAYHPHAIEEMEFANARAERFAGFDRGDTDWDYAEEMRERNEAGEAEYRRELAAAAAHETAQAWRAWLARI